MSSIAPTTGGSYAELRRIVRAEGLLEPQDGYYVYKLVLAIVSVAVTLAIPLLTSNPVIVLVDAAFLAIASTQAALLAHDIVHRQAFRNRRANAIIRYAVGNVLLGISHSWWASKHNQHHATPNHIDRDPDIKVPLVAFSTEQIARQPRLLRPFFGIQTAIFPLLFPWQSLSLRTMSLGHLAVTKGHHRGLQAALILVHLALYVGFLSLLGGWQIAVAFAVIHQAVFGVYNSSVFASNHKGMPLTDDGSRPDFLHEQILTSRDVTGPRFLDFWYGGLNYQIEHHLFPTMPRNRFPRTQEIVRDYCTVHGIPYHATSFAGAYRETFAHLRRVSSAFRRGATA